jgi:hypothetical protein
MIMEGGWIPELAGEEVPCAVVDGAVDPDKGANAILARIALGRLL